MVNIIKTIISKEIIRSRTSFISNRTIINNWLYITLKKTISPSKGLAYLHNMFSHPVWAHVGESAGGSLWWMMVQFPDSFRQPLLGLLQHQLVVEVRVLQPRQVQRYPGEHTFTIQVDDVRLEVGYLDHEVLVEPLWYSGQELDSHFLLTQRFDVALEERRSYCESSFIDDGEAYGSLQQEGWVLINDSFLKSIC